VEKVTRPFSSRNTREGSSMNVKRDGRRVKPRAHSRLCSRASKITRRRRILARRAVSTRFRSFVDAVSRAPFDSRARIYLPTRDTFARGALANNRVCFRLLRVHNGFRNSLLSGEAERRRRVKELTTSGAIAPHAAVIARVVYRPAGVHAALDYCGGSAMSGARHIAVSEIHEGGVRHADALSALRNARS